MKSFVSSVAIAAILSSQGAEAFAPPSTSRRVAVIAPSAASVQVHQHHDDQKRPQASYLLASNDNDNSTSDEDITAAAADTPSRRAKLLSKLRNKSKPITLALLTATSATFLPGVRTLLTPPAQASAPIVLRQNAKKDDPPMVQADKKAEKLKKQRSMEEFDAFMERANEIEETEGKAARDEYEKQYQAEKEAREAQKAVDVESLKRTLLDGGQDPNTDVDAQRQVFLLEHDVDLEKISGTPQNEAMIKNFQKRGKGLPTYKNQRYLIACQVADLKARGIDPMEHFNDPDVMDKTRAIYRMDDKVAEKVASQYATLMAEHGGRLTPGQGETPFVYSSTGGSVAASSVATTAASSSTSSAAAKEEKAAAKAAAKATRAAEREAAAEVKAQARAERAEAKAQAKADRAAAKEAKVAEKAAGAAAALAAKEADADAVSAMDDGEVAATANGDVSATAGNDAVATSSSVVEEVTQQKTSSSSKAKDLMATAKTYATPRNAATVVIGGGAAVYGFNYYQENSSSAQSERERQLKLILGDDEDDDDEDEFDDDDDEEDPFEQFNKKKPSPLKSEESKPKVTKPVAPPTPPAVPAPKPKRKLGIFAKRNANARETDLNVMVGPKAQAPEFATLLAQILTFGAPGRFPAVASWGDMPFEKFELDNAKSLLTESRENADLTDEQSAEIFASVVNCMIIDIVDLASSTLKGKNKDDKKAVDAMNVVMDFMDHAASIFDAVAKDVTIKPVTYGGNIRKNELEQMFSVYAGSSMMSLDGTGTTQDRVDTLQMVFAITDKKAEGLMQKHMMKMMMDLMKDGGKGLEGMEGMPGMEGMEDMMNMMGGAGGMPGMPGMDGEISPEELKQTVGMMKELMDSGQVSEEELAEVRGQFKEMYGSDIADLIKKADEEGAGEAMSGDERELLDMFKMILGE